MADIKNIKFGALTPDKRMTLHNGTVTEVKRTYKVVDGQAVVVWDIGEEELPTYDYYILTTWNLSGGEFSFPPIEASGKEHSGVIEWGDGKKEIYADSSVSVTHSYKSAGTYTIKLWGDFSILHKECFYQRTDLIAIDTIKSKIRDIGYRVFGLCTGLTDVKLHSMTDINSTTANCSCFFGCAALEEVVIPYATEYIGPSMFEKCTNLKKVTYSTSTVGLGKYAFDYCSNLKSFDFSKCRVAGTGCIAYSGITQVNLGAKFTGFQAYHSFGLNFYQTVPVQFTFTNNNFFKIIDGCIYYRESSSAAYTRFVYCPQNTGGDIVIQSGVTVITDYAFTNRATCTGAIEINSITIPTTVYKIEDYAMNEVNVGHNKADTVKVYYEGTAEQWSKVNWNYRRNTALSKAEKIFLGDES